MAKQEPYNSKLLVGNVESVFKNKDIRKLNNPAYKFIALHMGFIAHYDLSGFQSAYKDLREFVEKLQTSEYTRDREWNLHEADRQESDSDFRKWYGEEYQKSKASAIRGIVKVAQNYQEAIGKSFDEMQKTRELGMAATIAEKYGYKIAK